MKIPVTKPFFDAAEEKAVAEVLKSGWVTQGPKVEQFEEGIRDFIGAKYAVATTSATTALFLSLQVLGLKPGDEVIVPSFSFIATANVVLHAGGKPIFVDIDPQTYNLDPDKISRAITKKTVGIIVVDQVGLPAQWDKILSVAKQHNLFVLEDAACALGSKYKGKMIGSFADIAAFSFHPRKAITTGEGGMIVTKNKSWAKTLKMLRHHGMSISDTARHKATQIITESYPIIGFNFRMSDIQAAVGVEQLKKLSMLLNKRQQLAQIYTQAFVNNGLIVPPHVPDYAFHNYQSYIIRLKPNKRISRDGLMQKLLDKGIATRVGIMASHMQPAYVKLYGKISLPETEHANQQTITLPLYPTMTTIEQQYVIDSIFKEVG